MSNSIIKALRQIGKPPPDGLWSTEVQKRCYCFRTFLINHSRHLEGSIEGDITNAFNLMVKESREKFKGDWPAYCAYLLKRQTVPPPFNPDSFQAACRYLVTGENEVTFVPQSTLEAAERHIDSLYRKWLERSEELDYG